MEVQVLVGRGAAGEDSASRSVQRLTISLLRDLGL